MAVHTKSTLFASRAITELLVLLLWPAQFGRKIALGNETYKMAESETRPRRSQFLSRLELDKTLERLENVSRPRLHDCREYGDYNPDSIARGHTAWKSIDSLLIIRFVLVGHACTVLYRLVYASSTVCGRYEASDAVAICQE